MSDWEVSCRTCQEPVGEPWWPNGCVCDEPLTDGQRLVLLAVNAAWQSLLTQATEGT